MGPSKQPKRPRRTQHLDHTTTTSSDHGRASKTHARNQTDADPNKVVSYESKTSRFGFWEKTLEEKCPAKDKQAGVSNRASTKQVCYSGEAREVRGGHQGGDWRNAGGV